MSTNVLIIHNVKNSKHDHKSWLLLAFVIFGFAVLGYLLIETSRDFDNYARYFDDIREYGIAGASHSRLEPLFVLISYAFVNVTTNNFIVYMLLLTLSVSIKIYIMSFSRLMSAFIVSLLFYLFRFFPLHELTQIRIALAIGFFMLAFQFHGTRRAWLFTVLGCLTHYSAIVLLPLIFLVNAAQGRNRKYELHERTIWAIALLPAGLMATFIHRVVEYLTPNLQVLQMYSASTFGDNAVNPLNAAVLLDIAGIITGIALWRRMSASTRFWLHVQTLGIIFFYSSMELPVIAFRMRELFSVFWLFYIRDALEHRGIVRTHALLFSAVCIIAYFYLYFFSDNAIF